MLFVGATQMFINRGVHLCNAILVTKIFCYRYSTINNSPKNNILTKFDDSFSNLLETKCLCMLLNYCAITACVTIR